MFCMSVPRGVSFFGLTCIFFPFMQLTSNIHAVYLGLISVRYEKDVNKAWREVKDEVAEA